MHSRHACFTFILTVTCVSLCPFVRGSSSDVTGCFNFSDSVKVTKVECAQKINTNGTADENSEHANHQQVFQNTLANMTGNEEVGVLNFSLDSGLTVRAVPRDDSSVDLVFSFAKSNSEVSGRKMKMKMSTSNVVAMLFIPAMWIAGMMPWILPGIKMVVMMVTMMNNMAFSSALFSLIRGYLFDTRPEDHIVYLNYGYKNGHNHHHNNEINYQNNPYLYPHKIVAG